MKNGSRDSSISLRFSRNDKDMRKCVWPTILALLLGIYLVPMLFRTPADSAPLLANYYLGNFPSDKDSLDKLAKNNVLVVSPDQVKIHSDIVAEFKRKNPNMIILAYVPSQSYNTTYWPNDLIYRNMHVQDSWWLRDSKGTILSLWNGIKNTNMSQGWSEYVVQFINDNIAAIPNIDGVFFDMVGDGVVGAKRNMDVDLDGDGAPDDFDAMNRLWRDRTKYLLEYAQKNLKTNYIVMNGSSNELFQQYVNGRMFETFPTPWEYGGSWPIIMTALSRNQKTNDKPPLYILNANTHNTGKKDDYKNMRFGLVSSLLVDNTYFSFDYGDRDHHQVWWYDEYDAKLGDPTAAAESVNGRTQFQEDVWRRQYANGIAVVNPTKETKQVDLGGEYEKIIGTQDKKTNDGSIVDTIKLGPQDGIIMYKTYKSVNGMFFVNGSFVRFYKTNGVRARNGFFAFEENSPGSAIVYNGNLDNDATTQEKIVMSSGRMQIFNSVGAIWFDGYPLGPNFTGTLNAAAGTLLGNGETQIVVVPAKGGAISVFDYHGGVVKENIFPFGKTYKGSLAIAVGNVDGGKDAEAIVGTGKNRSAEVVIYDGKFAKVKKRFYPFDKNYTGDISIASGDFNGDGKDEIAVINKSARAPVVCGFDGNGKKMNEFKVPSFFGASSFTLGAADVNLEGRKEIVLMSGS